VGRGESWINWPPWAGVERRATIEQGVAPLLVGCDAGDVVGLHARMVGALAPLGRQWGAPGPIMQAISGAEVALWDLVGRARGCSCASLLGRGRGGRGRIAVYASGLGPDGVGEQIAACRGAGFSAVKLRVGFGLERDVANVQTAADAGVEVMVDANQAWSYEEALAIAPALRSCGVTWVEEPLRGGDPQALRAFRERTGLAVAAGENVYDVEAFGGSTIDVLQPDVSKVGGFTSALAVGARAAGRRVAPHLYGGALAYAGTLQLAACCEAVDVVEYDIRPNPLRDEIARGLPRVSDGFVDLPTGPGLGIELDEPALAAYEVPAPPAPAR
jgi:L-alanine-DL-glutamate epimerase-like enolase superfamily enzyme